MKCVLVQLVTLCDFPLVCLHVLSFKRGKKNILSGAHYEAPDTRENSHQQDPWSRVNRNALGSLIFV